MQMMSNRYRLAMFILSSGPSEAEGGAVALHVREIRAARARYQRDAPQQFTVHEPLVAVQVSVPLLTLMTCEVLLPFASYE